jgi:hypothetical protein
VQKKIIEIICALYYTLPLLQTGMRSCWTMQQICWFKNTILNSFLSGTHSLILVTITTSMAEPCSKYAGLKTQSYKLFCQVLIALYSLQLQPSWLVSNTEVLVIHNCNYFQLHQNWLLIILDQTTYVN